MHRGSLAPAANERNGLTSVGVQETEALLTNTRKLLKISLDEHSTFMKECRPGGRYCLQIQQQEQPMPHMQQYRHVPALKVMTAL